MTTRVTQMSQCSFEQLEIKSYICRINIRRINAKELNKKRGMALAVREIRKGFRK